ncbi:VanW family protein [Clostridium sp.]|uniref:VanW family protein n=1 Tax=Clostridium sp. TaxID=1506 RepID=UPI0039F491B1
MARSKKNTIRKKSNKRVRNLVFTIILLLISAAVSYVYFITQKFDNVMFPGVIIESVELSGKSKEEALEILKEKYSKPILSKKIHVKTPSKTYTINYSQLNPQYNITEVIDEAFAYGKNLNIISKYKLIKSPELKKYNLQFSYDHKPVDDMIESISKDINTKPKEATIKSVNGGFQVTEDEKGFELEKKKLSDEIAAKIKNNSTGDINIDAPIKVIESKVKAEALRKVDSKIGSFSTNYSSSSEGRATNIRLSTQSINGTVIMPGDTFSFNEVVGERTKERGYKEAGVIINQKFDSGLGGGICQVSSTLYNALLRANIKTTERVHHSIPSTYVEMGLDATVDWGNIDLKFKNTFDYPIYIEGFTSNRNVYFNIYSNSELAKRTYDITTEVYSTIEPTIKYIDDPSLPAGQTEVEKQPRKGYRVKAYRNIYENGKFIGKELISNDYYVPINGVIRRGTKK